MNRSNTARHQRVAPGRVVHALSDTIGTIECAAYESVLLALNAMMDAARVGASARGVAAGTERVAQHAIDTLASLRAVDEGARVASSTARDHLRVVSTS